jgi:hypothetical protein
VFVAKALARETVGPVEHERAGHIVRFMARDLGVIDGVGRVHRFAPQRARLRSVPEPAGTDGE